MPDPIKRILLPAALILLAVSCSKHRDESPEQIAPEPAMETVTEADPVPAIDMPDTEPMVTAPESADQVTEPEASAESSPDKTEDRQEPQKTTKSSWGKLHDRWQPRNQSSKLDRFPLPTPPLSSADAPLKFPGLGDPSAPLTHGKTNLFAVTPDTPFPPPPLFPGKLHHSDEKHKDTPPALDGRDHVIPTITILCYHQFESSGLYSMSAVEFRQNLEEIRRRGYTVVPLTHVIEYYQGKRDTLPEKSLVITIDDGYRSVYTHAYPLLKEFNYPWVFYIYPDFVGSGAGAVTWEQLKEMAANGMEIGAHSMSHSDLTRRKNKSPEEYDAWLEKEIVESRRIIVENTGLPVPSFSYPYGAFNAYVREKTIAAGYDAITTVIHANNHAHTNPMDLNRFVLTRTYPIERALDNADKTQGLALRGLFPRHGSKLPSAPEKISATLPEGFGNGTNSVTVTISGQPITEFLIEPDSRILTVTHLPPDLSEKVLVKISASNDSTGAKQTGTWYFHIEKNEPAPLPSDPADFHP
ncbi:polysaccharide deacetylase family protein [Oscillatoria laete-virens NRMC-F 0139]|nr:polysaccharide deacetylase family protein [Oscillatoria laete-virens]MDL5053658.1 polysaccharide deacetylase family protein [Oscillatoria laete-virens NRMC-F 0139]